MALQTQVIPINYGLGVDTKTDPKLVAPGKLLRLENALFTENKRVKKRNGYQDLPLDKAGGGTIGDPKLVATRGGELVAAADGRLYAFNEPSQLWSDKGIYESVIVTKDNITSSAFTQRGFNSCDNGTYILNVWCENGVVGSSGLWRVLYSVLDKSNNNVIIPQTRIDNGISGIFLMPKAVCLGGSQLAFLYLNTSKELVCVRVTVTAGVLSTATTTIATDNSATADIFTYTLDGTSLVYEIYDVQETATGAVVAYANTASAVQLKTINTSGAVVDTAATYGTVVNSLSVNVSTTGAIWVFLASQYRVYTSALVLSLSDTTIVASSVAATSVEDVADPTTFYVVTKLVGVVRVYKVTSAGVVTNLGNLSESLGGSANFRISGAAYSYGGRYYVMIDSASSDTSVDAVGTLYMFTGLAGSTVGSTLYADGALVAKCLQGLNDFDFLFIAFLIRPIMVGDSVIYPRAYATGILSVYSTSTAQYASCYIYFHHDHVDSYQAFEVNDVLVLNGGVSWFYDGTAVRCLGVITPPYIQSSNDFPTLGNMSNGTYVYYIIIVTTDKAGNIYRSAPSLPFSVTLSGGTTTQRVTLSLDWFNFDVKNVGSRVIRTMEVYRTQNAATGAQLIAIAFPSSLYEDTASDADIADGAFLYTTGGILENTAAPGFKSLVIHNNRAWVIEAENPNTVLYTKPIQPGLGLNFSDLLAVQVDGVGGTCSAVSRLDDKLVVMEQRNPIVYSGDGANDAGLQSTLSPAQVIPADSGCDSSKSVAAFPMGVIFKGPKGFYLLDRSLTTKYIGMSVEAYNTQDVTGSTMDTTRSHITFLTSSGLSLVYDYIFDQWSTFTNHEGVSACLYNGTYVYARSDGSVFKEAAGYYLDGTTDFRVLAQTTWLGLAGVQGFQRVRRFLSLGDYANGLDAGHGVMCEVAYDFDPTYSTPLTYLFGAVSTSGKFQYEQRLVRQKCDTLSVRVTEVTTGDELEYIDFTDMSFEAGMKVGTNKLAAGSGV